MGTENHFDPGLLMFAVQPRAGIDTAKIETALYEELAKLQSTPVTEAELRKAKNRLQTQFYRSLQTIAGRANIIGSYEVFRGGYEKLLNAGQTWEAVTAADIQKAAVQYLKVTNRTVGTLIPVAGKGKQ